MVKTRVKYYRFLQFALINFQCFNQDHHFDPNHKLGVKKVIPWDSMEFRWVSDTCSTRLGLSRTMNTVGPTCGSWKWNIPKVLVIFLRLSSLVRSNFSRRDFLYWRLDSEFRVHPQWFPFFVPLPSSPDHLLCQIHLRYCINFHVRVLSTTK